MRSQSVNSVLSSDIMQSQFCYRQRLSVAGLTLHRKDNPSCFPGELNLSKLGLYPRTQLSDRQMLPTPCYWEQSSSLCPDSYKLTQAQEVDGPIRMLTSLIPLPTLRNSPLLVQPERWIIALSKVRDPKPSFPAHLAGWPPAWSVSVFLP